MSPRLQVASQTLPRKLCSQGNSPSSQPTMSPTHLAGATGSHDGKHAPAAHGARQALEDLHRLAAAARLHREGEPLEGDVDCPVERHGRQGGWAGGTAGCRQGGRRCWRRRRRRQ